MAQQQSVNTSDRPTVVISEANGELRLMGWDRREVLARADGDLTVNQDGDTVNVRFSGEAVVRVPSGATLRIDQIFSDARIKGVDGDVTIGSASGDLTLRQTGSVLIQNSAGDTSVKHASGEVRIESVQGDLSIHGTQGPVSVSNVSGDLDVRALQGAASIGSVSGDLTLQGVQGAVSVDNVSGDVRLAGVQGDARFGSISGDTTLAGVQGQVTADQVSGDLTAEGLTAVTANVGGDASLSLNLRESGQVNVTAGGDITCRIPPDANVTLHLTSGSSEISLNLPGAKSNLKQSDYELKLGNGEVPVTLSAGGDLSVNGWSGETHGPSFDFDFDFNFDAENFLPKDFMNGREWGAFGERIAERARRAAERATERAREHAERASAKAAEQAERTARKAEEQVRRAQEHARKAERRAQFVGRRFGPEAGWQPSRPPTPPEPPSDPVSDEERLTILHMLEQKKITVEQAEKLLAALSGKER